MKLQILLIFVYYFGLIQAASVLDHQKFCFPYPNARVVANTLPSFSGLVSNLYLSNADIYLGTAPSSNVKYFVTNGAAILGESNTTLANRSIYRLIYHFEELPCDHIITQISNSVVTLKKGVNCLAQLDSSNRVPITNCTLSFDASLGTSDDNIILVGLPGRTMIFDSIVWEWLNGASHCNLKWFGTATQSNFLTISDNTTLYGDFVTRGSFSQQLRSTKHLTMHGSIFTVGSFQNRGNLTIDRVCPASPWVACEDQTYRHLTWGTNAQLSDLTYVTKQILHTAPDGLGSASTNNTVYVHDGSFAHKFETLTNATQFNVDHTTYLGSNATTTLAFEQREEILDIIVKKTCDYEMFVITTTPTFYNGTTCIRAMTSSFAIFDARGDSNAMFYIIITMFTGSNGFETIPVNGTNRHNIHWVVLDNFEITGLYPHQFYFDGHFYLRNLTFISSDNNADLQTHLNLNRYFTVNGSIYTRWSRFQEITNLHVSKWVTSR